MTTDQLGPAVEGEDGAAASARTGPPRPPREIQVSFLRNLYYFWVGRFGGALAYFLPAVVALVVFLARGPRSVAGWLMLAALVVSWLFYIRQIPDNWYGGGGTVGNRYFLNLIPLFVLMLPARREAWAVGGGVLSALVLAPMWLHPLHHSLRPGDHATRGVFPHLPPELTMLNDLSVFTDAWRKKVPYGDTEGDAHKHWPADPKAYFLYFMDNGTHGKETRDGVEGFGLHAPRAEVVLRALEPVRQMRVRITGGSSGARVTVRVCGAEQAAPLAPDETRDLLFTPGPGFPYYDTFVTVLQFKSDRDGVSVSIALEVNRRIRPAGKSGRPTWPQPLFR
jgi:hypothetical protein